MTPIAIVGLAGVFPGAPNVAAFWDNVMRNRSSISEVPPSRWRLEDYYDPDPSVPDRTYARKGGFMPDLAFDPVEFGLPPSTLEVTDVAQLVGLLVARDALADAGYGVGASRELPRERTGVILGIGGGQKLITPLTSRLQAAVWEEAMRSAGVSAAAARAIAERAKLAYIPWDEDAFPGLLGNVIAGRIANRLDLGGINCVVDAACASSLAAVRMAMSELAEGQCDVVISGGIDTDNTAFMYLCFSKTPAFSHAGEIRPFDAASDGMLIGEAAGMLVLKRLADAERDGDRVYAVIRGVGSSSDGRSSSIYGPRSEGQARALRRAYANAGVDLASVGLIEAHGTGTVAGDQVELEGLRQVFAGQVREPLALGSVKSQVGHGKAAAGVVSLIKTALALHHKVLPPTANVSQPRPALEEAASVLVVNAEARPWPRTAPDVPRRAGVSSFGFGGSNYHAVLEEYEAEQPGAYRLHRCGQPLLFAAASTGELAAVCRAARERLAGDESAFDELAAAAAACELGPEQARLGFVADGAEEALDLLEVAQQQLAQQPEANGWDHPRGICFRRRGQELAGRTVALFPGQGAQYPGMGRELALNFPEARETLALFDEAFAATGSGRLSHAIIPPARFTPEAAKVDLERLRHTALAQPAVGAVSAAMLRVLGLFGFRPDMAAGHSFGELTALWAAGALSHDAFARLAVARGQAMAPPDSAFDAGAMVSVRAGEEAIRPLLSDLDGLVLANVNSPTQVVLAGPTPATERALDVLARAGLAALRLPVSAAFHTDRVSHATVPFAAAVHAEEMRPADIPVYSNATGSQYPPLVGDMVETLVGQLLAPVNFTAEIERLYAAGGRLFVEVGPRRILTDLVHDILGERPHEAVAVNPSRQRDADRQLREALLKMRVLGLPVTLRDPYARTLARAERRHSTATITINGANYVSEASRLAYRQALAAGPLPDLAGPGPTAMRQKTDQASDEEGAVGRGSAAPVPSAATAAPVPPATTAAPRLPTAVWDALLPQQASLLAVHEQFLRQQGEENRTLLDILRSDVIDGASRQALAPDLRQGVFASLAALQELQAGTARLHQTFLDQQADWVRALSGEPATLPGSFAGVSSAPLLADRVARVPETHEREEVRAAAPLAGRVSENGRSDARPAAALDQARSEKAPAQAAPATPRAGEEAPALAEVERALLELASERTGYPQDVLDLDMDLEADLGIDSIKRVEILGAVRDRFPQAPRPEPAQLGELRTLRLVARYLAAADAIPSPTAEGPRVAGQAPAVHASDAPVAERNLAAPSAGKLASEGPVEGLVLRTLLELVSERTGYPQDVLEPDMDMEADLGIDSIKRVEILGAVRDRFPDAPQPAPAELGELRTLAAVARYLAGLHGHPFGELAAAGGAESVATGGELGEPAGQAVAEQPGGRVAADSGGPGPGRSVQRPAASVGIRLKRLPPPDELLGALPLAGVCLVSDDGTARAGAVVEALRRAGATVKVLQPPANIVPVAAALAEGIECIALASLDEPAIAMACQGAAGLVYLHPRRPSDGELFAGWEHDALTLAFLLAKHLAEPLHAAVSGPGRPFFVAAASLDGCLGVGLDGGKGTYSAGAGGLFGLVKSLRFEWPGVYCRALDLGPSLTDDEAATRLLEELCDTDQLLAEVGLGLHGRVTVAPAHR
ncbi:MAG TPA: beta-ketoacyl synthase N-terminal-like domain-containing protein [Chloroflexota bacterium]|nr:beta-ketoacyl synthase N-terminal-like domain-containing protein [Chloroflexota bacterium]